MSDIYYDNAIGPECDPLYQQFIELDKQVHSRLIKPMDSLKDLTKMKMVYDEYMIIRKQLSELLLNTNNDYFCG